MKRLIINDKYAISSDTRQWILLKSVKVNDSYPDGWKSYQFYSTFESLCANLLQLLIRTSEYNTVEELRNVFVSTSEMLSEKLEINKIKSL